MLIAEPHSLDAYLSYSAMLLADRDIKHAEDLVTQMSKHLPEEPAGWLLLAQNAVSLQQSERAVRFYSRAFEIDPTDVEVALSLGEELQKSGQPERAIEVYQRALDASGEGEPLLRALIHLLKEQGAQEAASQYEEQLQDLIGATPIRGEARGAHSQ